MSFDLLRPELLWLTCGSLALLAVGLWGLARRRGERADLVAAARLDRFLPDRSDGRALVRVFLAAAAVLLLVLALIGPVRGYTLRERVGTGLDIVVCVDTSRSMLARDVRPSRLERARREVKGLLGVIRGDRVALLAFSGDTREVAPLTHDRNALATLLERVSPGDNRRGGTNLASAIERALEMFDGRTGAHEAIVLLTDGEDHDGLGAALAAEAKSRGIRIFVVGIGTEGGGKIPILRSDGGEGFLRDREGEEVVTRLDRASLERIASLTGGEYLGVEEHPTPLEELYAARIARIEGRELVGGMERVPRDRFQWALALALACMLGETGLRERRPRVRDPRERDPREPDRGAA
ncbi:MAG: VWA domain-containing protein [Planctomycetota bacterium]|nr:VWA domain-containing protein [Planctomycetota bacterium]